jgi:endonuclease-3 related protein
MSSNNDLFFIYLLKKVYTYLLKDYGLQGWWPLTKLISTQIRKGWSEGYHSGDYSYPRDEYQKFEICVGTILTQNTSWGNAQKALYNLQKLDLLLPNKIAAGSKQKIAQVIRSSGYYNQKAERIISFAIFFIQLKSRSPKREELLKIRGIGAETADSILLYAYKKPNFVVDKYTIRILNRLTGRNIDQYDKAAACFYRTYLSSESAERARIFNEYHALLVKHAKTCCLKNKPKCSICPLRFLCNYS